MPAMYRPTLRLKLRQILRNNRQDRIRLSLTGNNLAASVAIWAKEGTPDPKVLGSNPRTAEGG